MRRSRRSYFRTICVVCDTVIRDGEPSVKETISSVCERCKKLQRLAATQLFHLETKSGKFRGVRADTNKEGLEQVEERPLQSRAQGEETPRLPSRLRSLHRNFRKIPEKIICHMESPSAASQGWAAAEFQIGLITATHRAIPRPKMM